jgi:prepilin-type N-terminal cleavage/methylation domain-containing protein
MARRSRSDSGFALVESMIVVLVAGSLVAITMPARAGGVGSLDQGMPSDHRLPEEE